MSVPRWYLWEGGFLLTARAQGRVPTHAHHAIQIVMALDGQVALATPADGWRTSAGFIVRPDAEHAFDCNGALGVLLFVDPESAEGAWLAAGLHADVTAIAETRLHAVLPELRPFVDQPDDVEDVAAVISRCLHGLGPGLAPTRRFDSRISTVIEAIRASTDLRISLEQAAGMACLSPTRFAHLFKEQVSLPFSRYMLWRKLTRAMVAIASAETIAAAAHAADFADAAHLTRTFYQMIGMAPSVLMRGQFIEIESPFSQPPTNASGRASSRPVK